MKGVTSWGKFPVVDGLVFEPDSESEAAKRIAEYQNWIPRGMGRSYGDSSLSPVMLQSLKLNRYLAFDGEKGILTCEAGVTFDDILRTFVPRGWFLPVTPGTKFITVGGAIGSDIHGKNHHSEGSFCRHVVSFDLLTATGNLLTCSPEQNPEIFQATCGGMGLTGFILRATFRLKKIETSFIKQVSIKTATLDEIFRLLTESAQATYSVAWIDTIAGGKNLGRCILFLGEHATLKDLEGSKFASDPLKIHTNGKLNVPFNLPSFTLNRFSISVFNNLIYFKQLAEKKASLLGYDPYFYPLDFIHNWNRIYGKRGFTQYQLVVPTEKGKECVTEVLEKTRKAGFGSFLSVMKSFGPQDTGLISFPQPGYTLTLDFPINDRLFPFLNSLDETVLRCKGRIYLTKDVRMNSEMMRKGYPGLEKFLSVVHQLDPGSRIGSLQSRRVLKKLS